MGRREYASVSPLTRRLFADCSDLQERLALLDPSTISALVVEDLNRSVYWPEVQAVLQRAVAEQRSTLVYGDYDVDGVVATLLLHRWLRSHDVPGNVFLPSRLVHGYGLDQTVIDQAIGHGYQTLIAVDCGTANLSELRQATEAGLDVAVIDHHEPKHELPGVPLLNPHLEQDLPPYCAAGLVYAVLETLNGETNHPPEPDELELAGLATLADVVPLVPHNWALAHHGLRALPETSNLGLAELIKVASLHGLTRLTARQASFSLIPRLNAAGRMRSPRLMFDLLAAAEPQSARDQALLHDRMNDERRRTTQQVTRAALLQSTELDQCTGVALYDADWHIGVLGIAAARVAEQLGKPAVVLADAPGAGDLLSGSARSFGAHSVIAALAQCAAVLESYGGHAQAAGVRLRHGQLGAFRTAFAAAIEQDCRSPEADLAQPPLPRVGLHELSQEFEADIWSLAPFGLGHPAPRCILADTAVQRASYMGRDKTHLNLIVTDGQRQSRLAGFHQSHLLHQLRPSQPISPVVEILPDNWNNRCSIMLRLLGLADHATSGSN